MYHFDDFADLSENFTDESVLHTIYNMSIKMNTFTLSKCKWRNKLIECSQYFRNILTEGGICFAFNALNFEDIYTKQYDIIFNSSQCIFNIFKQIALNTLIK